MIGGPGVARACLFHLSIYLFKSLWGLGFFFCFFTSARISPGRERVDARDTKNLIAGKIYQVTLS